MPFDSKQVSVHVPIVFGEISRQVCVEKAIRDSLQLSNASTSSVAPRLSSCGRLTRMTTGQKWIALGLLTLLVLPSQSYEETCKILEKAGIDRSALKSAASVDDRATCNTVVVPALLGF